MHPSCGRKRRARVGIAPRAALDPAPPPNQPPSPPLPPSLPPAQDEYEEFLARADLVQRQVSALASGALAPESVRLPGTESWAYSSAQSRSAARAAAAAAADSEERAKSLALMKKWDGERAARLAEEERDRWWRFARMQFGEGGVNGPQEPAPAEGEGGGGGSGDGAPAAPRWKWGDAGGIDYSWWDKYAVNPDDEVTVAEARRLAEEKERRESEAFERANPGFCMSFKKDQLEREHADREKARRAEAHKAAGNAAFGARDFSAALARYHDALRLTPFNAPVLNNITAAHVALGDWEAAREFASRALHVEPFSTAAGVKALFRRAAAVKALEGPAACVEDLARAAAAEPANLEVAKALAVARSEAEEKEKEARVRGARALAAAVAGGGGGGGGEAADAAAGAPPAPPSLAPDGLPSNAAIHDHMALGELPLPALLARTAARLRTVDAASELTGEGGGEGARLGEAALNAELRASSRELRALAARCAAGDDARVMVRSEGLLADACLLLCAVVARVATAAAAPAAAAAAAAAAPAPGGAGGGTALSHMAFVASLLQLCMANVGNSKNRRLLRCGVGSWGAAEGGAAAPPADSALGAALRLLSMDDARAAAGWAAAFGCAVGAAPWIYQLLAPAAELALAFALVRAVDPVGRASLVAHPYVVGGGGGGGGGGGEWCLTQRLRGAVAALQRPDALPVGLLATLAASAATLQHLAAVDHSGALLGALTRRDAKGPEPDPFAPLLAAVAEVVAGLGRAGSGGGGGGGAQHPVPALLEAAVSLLGRSLLDGAELLYGGAAQGVFGALANLANHAPMAAALCARAPGAAGERGILALRPIVDFLRVPLPPPLPEEWHAVRASALGALANVCGGGGGGACGGEEAGARAARAAAEVVGAGALPVLLGVLAEGGGEGARAALRARAALLLGRLASSPAAAPPLAVPATACRVLSLLAAEERAASGGAGDAAGAQLADGLLRLLAVAAAGGGGVAAALREGGAGAVAAAALRRAAPTLAFGYAGALKPRTAGAGNALKLLIALCEEGLPDAALVALMEAGVCEAVTEALMSPGPRGDPQAAAVRSNAAVAVARLARAPPVKERLRSLRALEALVQLQKEVQPK